MKRFTRRSFIAAGAAAAAAGPAWAEPAAKKKAAPRKETPRKEEPQRPPPPPEVVIIGAGAAGIAAARKLIAAGRRVIVLEAAAGVGGRCITDTTTFGVPFDRGAHWIHMPDINPVLRHARETGLDIYPAPPGQRVRIGRRYARDSEMEDYLAALVRANTAIMEAARGRADVPCAQALPRDLGEWRGTIEFFLGPYGTSKDLAEISAVDFARAPDRDQAAFCRQGFGALIARLAANLPVRLSTPVTLVDWGGRGVTVQTPAGRIIAGAAIVTASTNVLAANKIKFDPELPRRHLDALNRLPLGSYDHIGVELIGNPLDLRADELVLEKSSSRRTASLFAKVSGTTLSMIDVAGSFGRELAAQGEPAMVAFAVDWLANLYGPEIKKAIGRAKATRWNEEPWVLGAFSAAIPGGQPSRRVLTEPLRSRVWFAGEAVHETLWGTVGGAWESGERAADAVHKTLGGR